MRRSEVLEGTQFERLTTIREIEMRGKKLRRFFLCKCSCGNRVEVSLENLRGRQVASCGCRRAESNRARLLKHNSTGSREFRSWVGMRDRCRNPLNQSYARYGGRGIDICVRWDEFLNFLADMGKCPKRKSLDRIDNDKGYSPENCRWATSSQQARNRRTSRIITFRGATKHVIEWAVLIGVPVSTLNVRFQRGWSIEAALTTPLMTQYSRKR